MVPKSPPVEQFVDNVGGEHLPDSYFRLIRLFQLFEPTRRFGVQVNRQTQNPIGRREMPQSSSEGFSDLFLLGFAHSVREALALPITGLPDNSPAKTSSP